MASKAATPLLTEQAPNDNNKPYASNKRKYILISVFVVLILATTIILIVVLSDSKKESIDFEEYFLKQPSASHAKENSYLFTRTPHVAATKENYEYALEIERQFNEFGFESKIVNYSNIYLSEYVDSSLKQLNTSNPSQIIHEFDLSEDYIPEDPTSNTSLRHQAWLGYSPSGNITGYLVYVNYGDGKDFDVLMNKIGFDLENKSVIALVRYGALFRGLKALTAAQHGFKAVILFSDPNDYGFRRGDVIPEGPYLPSSGFQRGSAAYIGRCFGNPSPDRAVNRCGYNSTDDILPSIPIIPLSYGNAQRLMEQMGGMMVEDNELTDNWSGGMNVSYRIGTVNEVDGIMVNLAIETNEIQTVISNVEGFIAGSKYKNESILFGAHRDAWVYGAVDPISGTTSLLEIARAFSNVIRRGWKPLRNIYFLSWDAEEFDLIGSTEFGETEEEFVAAELVAYFNQDGAVSGPSFAISSDPFIEILAKDCMKTIKQPYNDDNDNNDDSVFDSWIRNRSSEHIDMLGSGSDYTVFVHEYGIASMDSGFGGGYGTYHSIYDSYYTMSEFIDPDYEYLRSGAQIVGLMGFKIVNNDILEFNMYNLYNRLIGFIDDINNLSIQYNCSVDNTLTQTLINSIEFYGNISYEFDQTVDELRDNENENNLRIIQYNYAMRTVGTKLLFDDGLPTRKLFKNLITAAAVDNFYGEQVLPYIGYAIKFECGNHELLAKAYNVTAQALYNAAEYLESYLNPI